MKSCEMNNIQARNYMSEAQAVGLNTFEPV